MIDSLEVALAGARNDTVKAQLLVDLCWAHVEAEEYDKVQGFAEQVIELSRHPAGSSEARIVLRKAAGSAHLAAGTALQRQGNYKAALDHFFKCARIRESLGTPESRASVYMNIGTIYELRGDPIRGFDYYQRGLQAMLASGNKLNIGFMYQNLGTYYSHQEEYDKALAHYLKGLEYLEGVGDQAAVARAYGNIGHVYCRQRVYDKALTYTQKSFRAMTLTGDSSGMDFASNALGHLYLEMSTGGAAGPSSRSEAVLHPAFLDSATRYLQRSLLIGRAQQNDSYLPYDLGGLGDVARLRDELARAEDYYQQALVLATRMQLDDMQMDLYADLSAIQEHEGRFGDALRYHKLYVNIKDSILDKDKQKALGRMEAKAEYDQENLRIQQEREQADVLLKAKLEKQAVQRNSLLGGLVAVLLLTGVGYRNYQNKRKAYAEVQHQKVLLEEKNKDITDSIRYAKRIQEAVLPPDAVLRDMLPDSFIHYRPKDIVSGDFYWFERMGDRVLLAVVDCTGHGVPGALMTIVASNGLTKALNDTVEAGPAEILDRLNWFVNESLRRTYEKNFVRDGMDIALCLFDLADRRVRFAGANRPLLLIRENTITEVKGDKHPVGIFVGDGLKPFTEHELQLKENDVIYLFTDGFIDQFGGEKGKKFSYTRLKDLLLSMQDRSMIEQRRLISEAFTEWKGDLEQVDDMCMIGLRIHDEGLA